MSSNAMYMMILALGGIWGGFILLLLKLHRMEKK